GSALMFSIGVPSIKVPIPDAASRGAGLVLASDFQRTSLSESPLVSPPRSFRKRVQKYNLFRNWQALFYKIFHLFVISLIYNN
ncbi:MAG: hypothetical protein K6G25_00835, partial [Bacteroidales bacterium]|nr:hypothetical protein [Bacteroidales bacterium]